MCWDRHSHPHQVGLGVWGQPPRPNLGRAGLLTGLLAPRIPHPSGFIPLGLPPHPDGFFVLFPLATHTL